MGTIVYVGKIGRCMERKYAKELGESVTNLRP